MENQAQKYMAEFIGTFVYVFVGTSVATLQGFAGGHGGAEWLEISFAFGFTLGVLVLVIGPVSGCHINPAVTIPMALSGRLKSGLIPGYIISQLAGAIAASFTLLTLLKGLPGYELATHGLAANGNPSGMETSSLVGWEILMTAMFLFTIFAATREDSTPGFAAVAIGGFLFVAHLVGVQLGDSSLNPARSIGPAIFSGGESLKIVWVFIAGPIVGGVIGWLGYRVVYQD